MRHHSVHFQAEQRAEKLAQLAHWLEGRLEREADAIDMYRLQVIKLENEATSNTDNLEARHISKPYVKATSSFTNLLGSDRNGGSRTDSSACSAWTAADEAMVAHSVFEELDDLEAKSGMALNGFYQKLKILMQERRAQLEAGLAQLATSAATIGSAGDAAATAQVRELAGAIAKLRKQLSDTKGGGAGGAGAGADGAGGGGGGGGGGDGDGGDGGDVDGGDGDGAAAAEGCDAKTLQLGNDLKRNNMAALLRRNATLHEQARRIGEHIVSVERTLLPLTSKSDAHSATAGETTVTMLLHNDVESYRRERFEFHVVQANTLLNSEAAQREGLWQHKATQVQEGAAQICVAVAEEERMQAMEGNSPHALCDTGTRLALSNLTRQNEEMRGKLFALAEQLKDAAEREDARLLARLQGGIKTALALKRASDSTKKKIEKLELETAAAAEAAEEAEVIAQVAATAQSVQPTVAVQAEWRRRQNGRQQTAADARADTKPLSPTLTTQLRRELRELAGMLSGTHAVLPSAQEPAEAKGQERDGACAAKLAHIESLAEVVQRALTTIDEALDNQRSKEERHEAAAKLQPAAMELAVSLRASAMGTAPLAQLLTPWDASTIALEAVLFVSDEQFATAFLQEQHLDDEIKDAIEQLEQLEAAAVPVPPATPPSRVKALPTVPPPFDVAASKPAMSAPRLITRIMPPPKGEMSAEALANALWAVAAEQSGARAAMRANEALLAEVEQSVAAFDTTQQCALAGAAERAMLKVASTGRKSTRGVRDVADSLLPDVWVSFAYAISAESRERDGVGSCNDGEGGRRSESDTVGCAFSAMAAFGVPDVDRRKGSGVSDPYVKFTLLDSSLRVGAGDGDLRTVQTHAIEDATEPDWGELELTLRYPIDTPRPPLIRVELWDKDFQKRDELIAHSDFRLARVRPVRVDEERRPETAELKAQRAAALEAGANDVHFAATVSGGGLGDDSDSRKDRSDNDDELVAVDWQVTELREQQNWLVEGRDELIAEVAQLQKAITVSQEWKAAAATASTAEAKSRGCATCGRREGVPFSVTTHAMKVPAIDGCGIPCAVASDVDETNVEAKAMARAIERRTEGKTEGRERDEGRKGNGVQAEEEDAVEVVAEEVRKGMVPDQPSLSEVKAHVMAQTEDKSKWTTSQSWEREWDEKGKHQSRGIGARLKDTILEERRLRGVKVARWRTSMGGSGCNEEQLSDAADELATLETQLEEVLWEATELTRRIDELGGELGASRVATSLIEAAMIQLHRGVQRDRLRNSMALRRHGRLSQHGHDKDHNLRCARLMLDRDLLRMRLRWQMKTLNVWRTLWNAARQKKGMRMRPPSGTHLK